MRKICVKCKKIIIEDWEDWLNKNRYEKEIQCPYCMHIEKLGWQETD